MTGFERGRFRALALDMDGTLTGPDGRVSERTTQVLARAELTGLRVVIINGMGVEMLERGAPRAEPVVKVMLGGAPADVDRAEEAVLAGLQGSTAARSMRQFIEATPADASKERALQAVLKRLGVAPTEVIAAGDADNDLGMLRMAGLAIAPGDAMPNARAAADVVVGPHDRDGVAEFLDGVLDALSRGDGQGAA
jgi:hydroxymethylpyrimidine pyrophosphatase-like HAD family hydrolase